MASHAQKKESWPKKGGMSNIQIAYKIIKSRIMYNKKIIHLDERLRNIMIHLKPKEYGNICKNNIFMGLHTRKQSLC